jgi:Bifunctional DNA primase/polymerase, N-terminal
LTTTFHFETRAMTELARAAVQLARKGLRVFPIVPGSKKPAVADNLRLASCNETIVATWWHKNPECNIGIACGEKSGVWVLDVDTGGEETLRELEAKRGELPATVEAITGGGGRRLYFKWPSGADVRTRKRARTFPTSTSGAKAASSFARRLCILPAAATRGASTAPAPSKTPRTGWSIWRPQAVATVTARRRSQYDVRPHPPTAVPVPDRQFAVVGTTELLDELARDLHRQVRRRQELRRTALAAGFAAHLFCHFLQFADVLHGSLSRRRTSWLQMLVTISTTSLSASGGSQRAALNMRTRSSATSGSMKRRSRRPESRAMAAPRWLPSTVSPRNVRHASGAVGGR